VSKVKRSSSLCTTWDAGVDGLLHLEVVDAQSLSVVERDVSNDEAIWGGAVLLTVKYWEVDEYLHKFAHDTSHRNGWSWWNSIAKDNPHLSIMHEVYMVPKKHWESIYINYHPTRLGKSAEDIIPFHAC
jgi:hypothetical protein